MACNISVHKPIFTVNLVTREAKTSRNYYIFLGLQDKDTMGILHKMVNEKKIKPSDKEKMKNRFGNVFEHWFESFKRGIKLHFIEDYLKMDDSLFEVRKKLFVYLSDPKLNKYLLPFNQEIWFEDIHHKRHLLGYQYYDKNTNEKIHLLPHIDSKYEIDEHLLNTLSRTYTEMENESDIKKEYRLDATENQLLLYDIFDGIEIKNNIIYVSDVFDEIEYLKKEKKIMNETRNKIAFERVVNGYLRKFWPLLKIDKKGNDVDNRIRWENFKKQVERNVYITRLIQEFVVDSSMFEDCSIKTVKFNINSSFGTFSDEENNNQNNEISNEITKDTEYVDLYHIFDYLREKRMGVDIPFIKYGDPTIDDPFIVISLKSIDENKLSRLQLYEWLGIMKDEERRFNGLQVKRFIKNYEDENKYSSINITRSGKIVLGISYKQENHATVHDMELAVKNCKKLIDDINQHIPDYRLIRSMNTNLRIEAPDMNIKDGFVTFKKNTKLTFFNTTIGMKLPRQIDFAQLKKFSEYFPSYLEKDDEEEDKNKKEKDKSIIKNSLNLRYKRVTLFSNMNEIEQDIHDLKNKGMDELYIRTYIIDKFHLTIEEAQRHILEWKRKNSGLSGRKIDAKFRLGVRIQILQNKILLDGITNIYQLPELYRFFTLFIYMFLHQEKYERNSDHRKFFSVDTTKKINKVENYEYEFEFGDFGNENEGRLMMNQSVMMDKMYNEIRQTKKYKEMVMNMSENSNELLLGDELKHPDRYISGRGTILAGENDIDINIRLDCGDNDKEMIEIQTCEDFCNDPYYFLRRLQLYDNVLFKFNVLKKQGEVQYSRCCQGIQQPIILDQDPEKNPRIKRQSYTYSYAYGSDKELNKRWYICPKIWCPYCEIPIYEEDIDPRTITKKLMKRGEKFCITCICPYGDHQAFIRDKNVRDMKEEKEFRNKLKTLKTNKEREKMLKEDEKVNKYYAYPGFAQEKHPKGFCLPCCKKKPSNISSSSFYEPYQRCLGETVDEEDKMDGQIYIKKSIPVDKNRFGIVPIQVAKVLNTTVETGPLLLKEGYFRKGIKQNEYNSFLTAIADILSCDKKNNPILVNKIKKILKEKLDEKLFRSLFGGNLIHVFNDPHKNTSAMENFIRYIESEDIFIDHTYLWDFLQRPGVLLDNGVNIFIFDDNHLLCPKGENIEDFYKTSRKNIIICKHKTFYEPVYHLQGNNRVATQKCIFESDRPEIKKLHEIAMNGCQEKKMISWDEVLQNSIHKYKLNVQQIKLDLGEPLMTTLEKILIHIKNNKLKKTFLPIKQYVDGYNKVYAIGLKNGLFVPVKPSKLYVDLPYQELFDLNDIHYLDFEETKRGLNELNEITKLTTRVIEKIMDKEKRDIIAVILENDRIVPIKKSKDTDKKMRESNRKFYSDVDYYIHHKADFIPDERMIMINKKNYEDESYQRLRFEISRYIQLKENREYKKKIMDIIDSDSKNLVDKRRKLYSLIQGFLRKIVVIGDRDFDYNTYQKPNKRVPCFERAMKKQNSNHSSLSNFELSCQDDPHCIVEEGKCKLYINRRNLLDHSRDNESFYLDRIVEELLRYPLKRNEIIYDNISSVINKEYIVIDPTKYIFIHNEDIQEIIFLLDKVFLDKKGIILDRRPLFEEFKTENVAFMKNRYTKSGLKLINQKLVDDLPGAWQHLLGDMFKVQRNNEDSLFVSLSYAFKQMNTTENMSAHSIKKMVVNRLREMLEQKSLLKKIGEIFYPKNRDEKMKSMNLMVNQMLGNNEGEEVILNLYKTQCKKLLIHIQSFESLLNEIQGDKHIGCEMDIIVTSLIKEVNIIILDKIKRFGHLNFYCVGPQFGQYSKYILLMKNATIDRNVYSIIEDKGKYLFDILDLPLEFKHEILDKCAEHLELCYQC